MYQQKTTTANDQLNNQVYCVSSQHPETSPHIFLQIVQTPSTALVAQQRHHIHTKQKPHDWHVLRPSQQNQLTHNLDPQNWQPRTWRFSPKNWAKRFEYHPNIGSLTASQRHLSNRPICSCSSSARRLKNLSRNKTKHPRLRQCFKKASQKK